MSKTTDVLIVVAVGAAAYVAWRAYQAGGQLVAGAGQAVREAVPYVTPWNPDNIVNRPLTAAVTAATGREETFGGWLWDTFNADPMDAFNKPRPAPVYPSTAAADAAANDRRQIDRIMERQQADMYREDLVDYRYF